MRRKNKLKHKKHDLPFPYPQNLLLPQSVFRSAGETLAFASSLEDSHSELPCHAWAHKKRTELDDDAAAARAPGGDDGAAAARAPGGDDGAAAARAPGGDDGAAAARAPDGDDGAAAARATGGDDGTKTTSGHTIILGSGVCISP